MNNGLDDLEVTNEDMFALSPNVEDIDDYDAEEEDTEGEEEESTEDNEDNDTTTDVDDVDDTEDDTEDDSEDDSGGADDDDDEDTSPYTIIARDLKEGTDMLASIDEDKLDSIESKEELYELMVEDFQAATEEWKASLNDNSQGLLKHLQNGGKVEDFIKVYADEDYSNWNQTDLEDNEAKQDKVLLDYWAEKGVTPARAKKKLERLMDKEAEAVDVLEEMQEIKKNRKTVLEEQTKALDESSKKAQRDMWDTIKASTENTSEFIPGVKVTKNTKEKVYKSIGDTWGKILNNPTKYAPVLAYMEHYNLLEGDFSQVKLNATTKANKDLKKAINKRKAPSKVDDAADYENLAKKILRRKTK